MQSTETKTSTDKSPETSTDKSPETSTDKSPETSADKSPVVFDTNINPYETDPFESDGENVYWRGQIVGTHETFLRRIFGM